MDQNTRSRPMFLSLPNELHHKIASFLPLYDTPKLLLTSKEVHDIYNPLFLEIITSEIIDEIENCHLSLSHECSCHGARSTAAYGKRLGCFQECSLIRSLANSAPLDIISRVLDRVEAKPHKKTKYRILDCDASGERMEDSDAGDDDESDDGDFWQADDDESDDGHMPEPAANIDAFTTEFIEDSFQTLCMWILKQMTASVLTNYFTPDSLEIVAHLAERLGPDGLNACTPCIVHPFVDLIEVCQKQLENRRLQRNKLYRRSLIGIPSLTRDEDIAKAEQLLYKTDERQQIHIKLAHILIKAGFDPARPTMPILMYSMDPDFRRRFPTYLHLAVHKGSLEMAKACVEVAGMDVNVNGPFESARYLAPISEFTIYSLDLLNSNTIENDEIEERLKVVRYLLTKGANISGLAKPNGSYPQHPLDRCWTNLDDIYEDHSECRLAANFLRFVLPAFISFVEEGLAPGLGYEHTGILEQVIGAHSEYLKWKGKKPSGRVQVVRRLIEAGCAVDDVTIRYKGQEREQRHTFFERLVVRNPYNMGKKGRITPKEYLQILTLLAKGGAVVEEHVLQRLVKDERWQVIEAVGKIEVDWVKQAWEKSEALSS